MQKNKSAEEFLSIQDFWQICLGHISWFVISLIVTFSAAIYYLSSTPDMFTREAAVLVKQETTSPMVAQKSGGEDFNNMALVQQPTSVPNVQRQYTSLTLLTNVVRRLNLASDSVGIIKTAESI
ncbi:MAG: hypothetical protein SOW56_03280, partial [Bacteroidaceae bacterium]|nr:hypothetical protein [Bacteroidaceae bacterium]